MPSYNTELSQRANKHGFYVVYIRITENRKMKRIATDVMIPKEHYNPKAKYGRWVRASNMEHAKLNRIIEESIEKIQRQVAIQVAGGGEVLKGKFDSNGEIGGITVKTHFENTLEAMKVEKSFIYYKGAKSMFTRFQEFVGEDTRLADITPDHVQRFKIHLIGTQIKNVTINNIMKRIHNTFIPAMRMNLIDKDPFRSHDTLTEVAESKQRLTDDQIEAMENLTINTDNPKNWLFHTRNMYLFSYYNAGIRVADLMQLRHNNVTADGRLEYEMDKTGHKKSIKLNKAAVAILAYYQNPLAKKTDYIFPVLDNEAPYAAYITYSQKKAMSFDMKEALSLATSSKTSQINNNLKTISKLIKLDKSITFHTARHSFADKARRSMKGSQKITLFDIKNALGHKSIVTTERYMNELDKESLDEAMDDIFG
jgi:site-specific recombinase XerD